MNRTSALLDAAWSKSTYSTNGGNCLEWQTSSTPANSVRTRDSKRPTGPVLQSSPAAWSAFVSAIRDESLPSA
ncbi:DUF397 domain-containing protein [Streptomyces roseifaciens]